jgi:hypothetical protein
MVVVRQRASQLCPARCIPSKELSSECKHSKNALSTTSSRFLVQQRRRAKVTFAHSWQLNLMNVTNQDESIAHLRKSACVFCVIATVCHCQSDPAPAGPETLFLQRERSRVETRVCARSFSQKIDSAQRAPARHCYYFTMRRYWAVTLNLVSATIIFRESAALLC